MEKVIRVCEFTGRVTTVAECVTTERAKEIIKELAPKDEFGRYMRIEYNYRNELKRAVVNNLVKA
jgi:hypothetical protein